MILINKKVITGSIIIIVHSGISRLNVLFDRLHVWEPLPLPDPLPPSSDVFFDLVLSQCFSSFHSGVSTYQTGKIEITLIIQSQ